MRGFSLLELMVVLTIITILLVVSVQGYQAYFSKVNRQHATLMLYSITEALEGYYQKHATYEGANLAKMGVLSKMHSIKNYNFVIANATEQHFTILAYAQGLQANVDKTCKILSLNDLGEFNCRT
jgi:prepilin-type N-terminal cleavage/methylation domain-containing protein